MKKAFTLAELLIVIAIIGILAAVVLSGVGGACDGTKHGQEMSTLAEDTAVQMGYQEVVALCEGTDSDGDGKVSCTVTHIPPGGTRQSIPFVCPSRWSRSSTCQVRGFGW